jgi:hypothetical protein
MRLHMFFLCSICRATFLCLSHHDPQIAQRMSLIGVDTSQEVSIVMTEQWISELRRQRANQVSTSTGKGMQPALGKTFGG